MNQMNQKPCRRELLNWINVVSFAVLDAQLFLDTHPSDAAALSYLKEYSVMRNQALEEYARFYGPLTIDTTVESCQERWSWVDDPWPWQEGGC